MGFSPSTTNNKKYAVNVNLGNDIDDIFHLLGEEKFCKVVIDDFTDRN